MLPFTKSRDLLGDQLRSRPFKIHGAKRTDSHTFLACKTCCAQVCPTSHWSSHTAACHRSHQAVTVGLSFVQTKEKRANYTKLYKQSNRVAMLAFHSGLFSEVAFDSIRAVNARPLLQRRRGGRSITSPQRTIFFGSIRSSNYL